MSNFLKLIENCKNSVLNTSLPITQILLLQNSVIYLFGFFVFLVYTHAHICCIYMIYMYNFISYLR